jgi:hypothetical protein
MSKGGILGMNIERDAKIEFHELGTLTSVTRWISTHDEGLAEWLKNARRAYQPDRANVDERHRVAVLLLRDVDGEAPARIGLLDVGGATVEDVTRWSTWQDPDAASRGSGVPEEETQGNGGKAYMYRLFRGPARILGVRDKKLNRKGFEGPSNSLDRGIPGFMPDIASGRDLPITSWESELRRALEPYDISFDELPKEVQQAVRSRTAFTLVEGFDPVDIYKGRIPAEDLVHKVLRHDQSTLAVQQLRLYAIHNGRAMNEGKPLDLEPIVPYPGFEIPIAYEIPEELPDDNGVTQSTTLHGARPRGRLILYTSRENMPHAYKKLKPRWKVTYRTEKQMIGSKPLSELVPTTPGSYFIYATVELSALEPDYVALGRVRPNEGPLVEAVDRFVADKVRALAKEISDRRRQELDQQALDEVHEENRKLDNFKNRFLPSGGIGGDGGFGEGGKGPKEGDLHPDRIREYGEVPESIVLEWDPAQTLRIGRHVKLRINSLLKPRALDGSGRLVARVKLEWISADRHIVRFEDGDLMTALSKGTTEVWARIKGMPIESSRLHAEVWTVDHVLLTPRTLEIPLGRRKQIVAEVTSDEGFRSTNVFLNWEHDADDPLIVRIIPTGLISGNRLGSTSISAGAGDPTKGGVWARIRADVTVIPNPEQIERGGGYPQLLLTGRDTDPATGEIRRGDPDQPTLWQEVTDYQNNIWWLNLDSPEAAFFFKQRTEDSKLWRGFHAQKVVDMVIQVHMKEAFTAKGDAERPDLWSRHKAVLETYQVELTQAMWEKLQSYVQTSGGLD